MSPIIVGTLPNVTINSFLEDTCVLVAMAFLIIRGPLERKLANPLWSGPVFGLLGMSEAILPSARFPYAAHTLATAAASLLLGWRSAVLTAFLSWVAALAFRSPGTALVTVFQGVAVVLVTAVAPKPPKHAQIFIALTVAISQCFAILVGRLFPPTHESLVSFWTVPANTFGVLLLGLVLRDARVRSETEHHRQESAEARQMASEAQLGALRARVRPHFLFNALNAIAALCEISPERASRAATRLGALMRGSLETNFAKPHSLCQELEIVRNYAEIEVERFGSKLTIEYLVEGCEDIQVPTFGVQTLVENAILHGVSGLKKDGRVLVLLRKRIRFATIAVADNGVGLTDAGWHRDTPHGLNLLEAQLSSQIGPKGKLRILPRSGGGTLAVLRVPLGVQKL